MHRYMSNILVGVAVGTILGGVIIHKDVQKVPLNVRNNNPCNIKYLDKNEWQGSIYKVGTFEKFKNKEMGLRACKMVIRANTLKTDSVDEFVLRFASEPSESLDDIHLRNYSNALKRSLGYSHKIRRLDTTKTMRVVIKMEGGKQAVTYYNTKGNNNAR